MGACNSTQVENDDVDASTSEGISDVITSILRPGTSVKNEAGLKSLQMKIQRKINNRSIHGSTKMLSNQSIRVSELPRNGPLDDFYKKTTSETKGPFGLFGKKIDCPIFACSYDINQNSSYKVKSFNSSLLEEEENILNDIEQKMIQDASINLEGNPSGLRAANEAINEARDIVRAEINTQLSSLSRQDSSQVQELSIEYIAPPRCKDPCGWDGGPFGPELSQNAQLEIISEQILNSVSKIYEEKFKEMGLEATQEVSVKNTACILQMAASLVGCIICLIIVWKMIKMMEG